MARGEHGALNQINIRPGLLHDLGAFLGAGRHCRHGARHARGLDGFDPVRDQLRLDRLAIRVFEDRVDRALVGLGDLPDHRGWIVVARMHSVEVEHRDAAQLAHGDGELDVDHAVHGRPPERKGKSEPLAHRKRDVDLVRVEGHASGNEGDLIEAVGSPSAASDANLEIPLQARLLPGNVLSGLESGLLQGVLTPLNGAGSANYTRPLFFSRCTARSSTSMDFPTKTSSGCARSVSTIRTSFCTAPPLTLTAGAWPRRQASAPIACSCSC